MFGASRDRGGAPPPCRGRADPTAAARVSWFQEAMLLARTGARGLRSVERLYGIVLISGFRRRSDESAARAANACRFVLVAIYAWSGLHKMNAAFVAYAMPRLASPIVARVAALAAFVTPAAYAAPVVELAIALGLL